MKYIISICVIILVLGSGCNSIKPTETHISNDDLSKNIPSLYLENKSGAQDAVFMLAIGITGGMGSTEVLIESDESEFLGSIYLRESDILEVLSSGGGLSDCYIGNPEIVVSANVSVVEKKDINDSMPEPEETAYHEVQVNELYYVNINVEVCDS